MQRMEMRKIKLKKWKLPRKRRLTWGKEILLEAREKRNVRGAKVGGDFLHMLKGMAVAFAVTCIFFVAYGMCLTYTEMSMDTLPVVSLVCTAISAAIVGFDWAKCKGKRSLFWGMGAGLCYGIVLFLLTSLGTNDFSWSLSLGMTFVVAVAGGGLGGGIANFVK